MSHTFEKADMGYTTGYYDGVAAGKRQAEARIIKLLDEAKTYQQLERAIALIKGENE